MVQGHWDKTYGTSGIQTWAGWDIMDDSVLWFNVRCIGVGVGKGCYTMYLMGFLL